jgi:hypothetical protein
MTERLKGAIETMIEEFRAAASRAEGPSETTIFAMPAYVAHMIADRLELTQDRMVAKHKFESEMQALVDTAEEAMRMEASRFALAIADLEIVLEKLVRRHPATMTEVSHMLDRARDVKV